MPKTKAQKKAILDTVGDKLSRMKSAVMFNFSGIEVKELNKLREKCREEGIDYMVAKKTLLKKALTDKGLGDVATKDFGGEIATVFSYEDEIAPARIVATFAKANDKVKFAGGIFEGGYIDTAKVIELSRIPSRKELLAKVVGCLSNPLSGLVRVLNAVKEDKEKQTA
jgi:large subunit ribosomal protein L10